MRAEFGDKTYGSWIKPLTFGELQGQRLRLAVPTRFMRDWVEDHYLTTLTDLWRTENTDIASVEIIVKPATDDDDDAPLAADSDDEAVAARPPLRAAASIGRASSDRAPSDRGTDDRGGDRGYVTSAVLDERLTFTNFVVGPSNELAHAAARRVAESKEVPFNPLFLYGGVGLGKTHLMNAIAWQIRERDPSRRVLYMSGEKFMYEFIRALRYRTNLNFKEQFRSVDVLMIDDIQFIAGKDSTQEEFFHTFNAIVDQKRQIIVSADKSPSDLELEARLKSRLGWGLVADIHPTDYELRLGIMQLKAEQLNVEFPANVLEFLAHRITSNIRELEGALNRLAAHQKLVGRPITLEVTQEALADLLRSSDRRITIEQIQRVVVEHFRIRMADMHSARRARAVARPRQIAMYLAKQLTPRSLPEIGKMFGGRDHTTVMHAVRRVDELRAADAAFNDDIENLRRLLET